MAKWTIWTNVSITRRKSYHLVTSPDGETRYRDRHFWPCVEWLAAEGVDRYLIRPSEHDGLPENPFLSVDRSI